jgi:transcription initiation factor IIE alpha subunit
MSCFASSSFSALCEDAYPDWVRSLKDDDLAGRMGLQPKELNKVIAVLSNDCLVKMSVHPVQMGIIRV